MPAVHALMQAGDEIARAARGLTVEELWAKPGGAAPVGFHLKHVAGSIDRLLTYARGGALDRRQLAALSDEAAPGHPPAGAESLITAAEAAIATAIAQIRATPADALHEPRTVGRAALPQTVFGLLFHVAEHTQRHAGQIVTLATVVRGNDP